MVIVGILAVLASPQAAGSSIVQGAEQGAAAGNHAASQ